MRARTVLVNLLLLGLCWAFWDHPVLYPLRLFVVLLHELGHATAALLTGGGVERIELQLNESGLAMTRGGIPWLVLNGGYLGSLLFGCLFLMGARSRQGAQLTAVVTAGVVSAATVLYVRPLLSTGFLFAFLASAFLLWVAFRLRSDFQAPLLRFLGLFSCLYALFDIRDDILLPGSSARVSDATLLANHTHIPAPLWGMLWILLSLLILFALRRKLLS